LCICVHNWIQHLLCSSTEGVTKHRVEKLAVITLSTLGRASPDGTSPGRAPPGSTSPGREFVTLA